MLRERRGRFPIGNQEDSLYVSYQVISVLSSVHGLMPSLFSYQSNLLFPLVLFQVPVGPKGYSGLFHFTMIDGHIYICPMPNCDSFWAHYILEAFINITSFNHHKLIWRVGVVITIISMCSEGMETQTASVLGKLVQPGFEYRVPLQHSCFGCNFLLFVLLIIYLLLIILGHFKI